MKHGKQMPTKIRGIIDDILETEPAAEKRQKGVIEHLVKQIHSQYGEVTPADRSNLAELLALDVRMDKAKAMADIAFHAGNVEEWQKVARLIDQQSGLRRALMRDLRVLRASAPSTPSASEKKAEKSGSGWKGIL